LLRKPITYTDFNGDEQTEDFYFNLTKAELVELEMGHEGGLSDALRKIVASKDGAKIMQEFKSIILRSYGQRSMDGKRFVKSQQLRDEFESTEAYSELFMSIVTDPEAAADFVRGIMPGDLMAQAQLTMETEVEEQPEKPAPFEPPAEPKLISWDEAQAMDASERQAGLNSGSIKVQLTRADMEVISELELMAGVKAGHFVVAPEFR
jgi:hypothetical protein